MVANFKQQLASARSCAADTISNATDAEAVYKKSYEEMESYKRYIPEFFSYNGEAARIKSMYKKLRDLSYIRNRVIPCVNVATAVQVYTEYLNGMVTFIHNLIQEVQQGGANVALMERQLQTATQADPLFIESLFGGKNNEIQHLELTTAVQNVEYFVDFKDVLVRMLKIQDEVFYDCQNISEKYPHIINAVKLLTNSIGVFCNNVICNILTTYEAINNTLDNKLTTQPVVDTSLKVF